MVFDFDGVIIDSIDETAVTTFSVLTGEDVLSLEDLDHGFLHSFRNNRHLVQNAGDFIVLGKWCQQQESNSGSATLTKETFKHLQSTFAEHSKERVSNFFKTRSRLMQKDRDAWLALHRPYQPLFKELLKRKHRLILITNKNRKAVLEIMEYFGWPLDPLDVYSADGGFSKIHNFEKVASKLGRSVISYIDDNVSNLYELKTRFGSHINCYHARWGYTENSEIIEASRQGFIGLDQNELLGLLPHL